MNRGSLAVIESATSQIESFQRSSVEDDYELQHCLEIRQTHEDTVKGNPVQIGRAASQILTSVENTAIKDGNIVTVEDTEVETKYTNFVYVPNRFLLTTSGGGEFLHGLIESYTGEMIEKANIDIDKFLESKSNPDVWKLGFVGRSANAEKGVLYGQDINNDTELGEIFSKSSINQVGIEYEMESKMIKLDVSRGGYVSLYQPGNYDLIEFSQFIDSEIMPHIHTT